MRRVLVSTAAGLAVVGSMAAITQAEPADKVAPTVLHEAVFDRFKVKTPESSPLDVELKAKTPVKLIVRQHDYAVGGHTGWHSHPGPVFIEVTSGELTVYEYDDPTCTGRRVRAGETFVDDGHGHIVRNESGAPAQDISIIAAPETGPFRTNLAPRTEECGF